MGRWWWWIRRMRIGEQPWPLLVTGLPQATQAIDQTRPGHIESFGNPSPGHRLSWGVRFMTETRWRCVALCVFSVRVACFVVVFVVFVVGVRVSVCLLLLLPEESAKLNSLFSGCSGCEGEAQLWNKLKN